MTNEALIEAVNSDLANERKHLAFYQHASVMIGSLHRQELREYLFKEAQSELLHVDQFSELVVHLGGVPSMNINEFPVDLTCPAAILRYAVEMEEEVATIYAERLRDTDDMEDSDTAYVHVFYEAQIEDSWKAAKELKQMIRKYEGSTGENCAH